jgi:Transmembrane secretion effector
MLITANKRAPSARGSFSPLRHAVFRRIWTASLLSNLGILVLGVGAAWTMTQISASADMVALVQTSLMPPVALVSTRAQSRICLIGGLSDSSLYRSRWRAQFRSRLGPS